MKYIISILFAFLFASCIDDPKSCNEPAAPPPPFPNPNDSFEGFATVYYEYECLDNQYRFYSWTLEDNCIGWVEDPVEVTDLDPPEIENPEGFLEDPDSTFLVSELETKLIFNCIDGLRKEYTFQISDYCSEWVQSDLITSEVQQPEIPGPPFPNPDNTTEFDGGDGYFSVDYTWYCLDGKYVSYDYTKFDNCSEYELTVFESDGIGCD